MATIKDLAEQYGVAKDKLNAQDFEPNDSIIASSLMHPQEAARRAKDSLMRSIDTAAGVPREILDESSVFPFGIAPSIDEQAQAGLDLAGLMQTGAMPFAPASAGGTLGMAIKALKLHHGSDRIVPKIERQGLFDAIFATPDRDAALSHGDKISNYYVNESKIGHDFGDKYDDAMTLLRHHYPNASDDDIENILYPAIAEDVTPWNMDHEEVMRVTGVPDMSEASWKLQADRGKIGKALGYDAVKVRDEHGDSYMIPFGSKAKYRAGSMDDLANKYNEMHPDKNYLSWDVTSDPYLNAEGDEVLGDPYALIEKVYTHPDDRNKGVATRLMSDAMREIESKHPNMPIKLSPIPLDKDTDIDRLMDFYRKFGFDEMPEGHMQKYAQGGIVKAQEQNENLGRLAEMLGSARDIGNEYKVPSWVPLAGGTGAGDLLMGRTPEEIENWSYGNAPMQIPEMSNVPQFKRGRAQSLADALTTLAPGVKATEDLPVGMAIKAYHGTPHLFDRFDMSKLGTGEGAQSYGHGLYFAQDPSIAESYRKKLSDAEYKTKRGGDLPYGWKSSINEMRRNGKNHEDVVNFLQGIAEKQTHPNWKDAKKLNERIQKGNVVYSDPGRIYETSIQWPNAEREAIDPLGEHHLLDWYQPAEGYVKEAIPRKISELQNARDAISSKYVDDEFNSNDLFSNTYSFPSNEDKAAMDKIAEEINMHKYMSNAFEKGAEGSVTYNKLIKMLGSPEKASEYLHSIDIPGIKYLDATSRGTDNGTRNFVTFGDEYPQIVKRAGSLDDLQEKNLNKRLIEKYLSTGKLTPEEMAKYEKNALKMETPNLQKYNLENANLQGGTPESRSQDLGFNVSGVHRTDSSDIKKFLNKYLGKNTIGHAASKELEQTSKLGHWFGNTGLPDYMHGNISYPVAIKMEDPMELSSTGALIGQLEERGLKGFKNYMKDSDSDSLIINRDAETKGTSYVVPNPNNIRSRFAAFDPLRKNSSSIMASGLLGGLGLKYANDDEPKYAEGGSVDKDSLQLNKPQRTPSHPDKSHIVKTMVDGKEKIIRFGEQGAETAGKPKEGESDRMTAKRESFKARHAKNIAKGPSSAAYWANKVKWAEGGEVDLSDNQQMKAIPQQPNLARLAELLQDAKSSGNQYSVPNWVPLLGGSGAGDMLLGNAPEEIENWSYGDMPMRVPEMSNVPQFKKGRAQSLADTAMLLAGPAESTARNAMAGNVGMIIKPKGGNWLDAFGRSPEKSATQFGRSVDPELESYARAGMHLMPHEYNETVPVMAVNDWLKQKLGKYIQNEMATPEDPIRRIAEEWPAKRDVLISQQQSKIPKLQDLLAKYEQDVELPPEVLANRIANTNRDIGGIQDKISELESYNPLHYTPRDPSEFDIDDVMAKREAADYPEEGIAKTHLGKLWEHHADDSITPIRVKSISDMNEENNPWLKKLDEEDQVYFPNIITGTGFDKLTKELRNASRPDTDLPDFLRIDPAKISRVSVPQAVEHVAKINAWRDAERLKEGRNSATVMHKEYPDQGLSWMQMRMPENQDKEALRAALKFEGDTMGHCVGQYCDEVAGGDSNIYSLRDRRGEPHVTIETQKTIPNVAKFFEDNRHIIDSPEFQDTFKDMAYLNKDNYDDVSQLFRALKVPHTPAEMQEGIKQIKGKQNAAPNTKYMPAVHDFVRSKDWSSVGDLDNTYLYDLSQPFLNPNLQEMVKNKYGKFATDDEINEMQQAFYEKNKDIPLKGFAKGGEVSMDDLPFNDSDQLRLYHQAMKHYDDVIENTGASKKTGKGTARVNYSTLTKGDIDKENALHTLMANYGVDIGDLNLDAGLIKPMEADGLYIGDLTGSLPLGEGRASLGVQGIHSKYDDGLSGYTAGYNGKVGDGNLSARYFEPADHNSAGRQVQLEYALPFAKGGEVKDLHNKYEESDYGYGNRPDKTKKGIGYFGELERPDGTGVMTEYSIGVPINGEEMDVPTLIPTLTPDEIRLILHMQDGEDMPRSIVHKAIDHAHQRLSEGKPIFATDEDLYAHGGIVDVLHNDAIEQIMKAFMESMADDEPAVSIQITTQSQPLKSGKIPTSIREAKHG